MHSMKIILLLCLVVSLAGCGGEKPKPADSAAVPPPASTAPPPIGVPMANDRDVCPKAGIGDKRERFAKEYAGESKDAGLTSFGGGKYRIVFIEGRAFNITAPATPDGQMDANLVNMIPTDAELVGQEERPEDAILTRINRYTSQSLADACPRSGGKFEVCEVHDKRTGQYTETVIACQIELPKGKGNEKSETETLMDQK